MINLILCIVFAKLQLNLLSDIINYYLFLGCFMSNEKWSVEN